MYPGTFPATFLPPSSEEVDLDVHVLIKELVIRRMELRSRLWCRDGYNEDSVGI